MRFAAADHPTYPGQHVFCIKVSSKQRGKMNFGKTWKRASLYITAGIWLALGGFFSDVVIEDIYGLPHYFIMLYAIPLFTVIAILLARRDVERSQRSLRLEQASHKMGELMAAAIESKSKLPDTAEDGLPTCWEQLDCDKTDCPVYGREHTRCWLVAGTFCRGEVQGKFANKLGNCRECEVYKTATSDPVTDIEEHFWGMMHVLQEREDELEILYGQAEKRSQRLKFLLAVSEQALSTLETKELFTSVLEYLAGIGTDVSAIFTLGEEGETLEPIAAHGFKPEAIERLAMKMGENIPGQAFSENRIIVSEDLPRDERLVNDYIRELNPQTVIGIPLTCRDKQIGVLAIWTFESHHYGEDEKQVLQIAADQIAMAIDNASLFEETRRMAITDGLTGLVNHRAFYKTLEREMDRSSRYGHPLSLLMLDIDDFKGFNDSHGHVRGDRVLAELGHILTDSVRTVDTVARYGGEEFAVILPETACMTAAGGQDCSAQQVAERIRAAVAGHMFEGEDGVRDKRVTVSIGVSEYPVHAGDMRALVQTADEALYQAKSGGKDHVLVAGATKEDSRGEVSLREEAS